MAARRFALPPCSHLVEWFRSSPYFTEDLITQRIRLALEKQKVSLALYLLTLYKPAHKALLKALAEVHQNPQTMISLPPSELRGDIILYGLKRQLRLSLPKAIALWQNQAIQSKLKDAQTQAFLRDVTLYKAMRNQEDSADWFAKIKPKYRDDVLIEWQIRLALKRKNWGKVVRLIGQYHHKDDPCWQYWLARSLAHLGQKEAAFALYHTLSSQRNYYGFLASLQTNKALSFHNEKAVPQSALLAPYQPFLHSIKTLYAQKQALTASRLLNDFISELPKNEASALVYWIDKSLGWYGKSVYLSNTNDLSNQLSLRFPLAYQEAIHALAKNYAIPKAFIYAIIRQESAFREEVVSPAGARGLMQLMPRTAALVAKGAKIPYKKPQELFLTQKNLHLGVAYLHQLAQKYAQHPVLIAAAYNAGPQQVHSWLKNNPSKNMDIWIETIPWQETRNYLKNIVAFYAVYQYRMQQKSDLSQIMHKRL